MQVSLSNYSVNELIATGFSTFKDAAREAGRYFSEAEAREPGSVKRYCLAVGGDFRDATRSINWYQSYAGEEKPERTAEPKPKTSPYEKALKAGLRLPPKERHVLCENLVMTLGAGQ